MAHPSAEAVAPEVNPPVVPVVEGEAAEKEEDEAQEEEEEDIYIPQAEYTAVCNADFAPMVCNDFMSEFLLKEHGACNLERTDAIDLTRNFCYWVA